MVRDGLRNLEYGNGRASDMAGTLLSLMQHVLGCRASFISLRIVSNMV